MKHTFDIQFRAAHPETIGETDKDFDLHNYVEWLEGEYVDAKTKLKASDAQLRHNKALNIADVSHRRELLNNFSSWLNHEYKLNIPPDEDDVNRYLKNYK